MKQMSSKLNMYIKGVSVVNNNIEKLILNIIFGSFGILALIYILLLGNMVRNIIERQSFEAQARSFSNEVRTLESTYLSLSNSIDLNLAHSMGFKETKATFVTRKTLGFNSSIDNIKVAQNDL
ncbi:MAG: hypothetical protein WCG28_01230 [bacterium]